MGQNVEMFQVRVKLRHILPNLFREIDAKTALIMSSPFPRESLHVNKERGILLPCARQEMSSSKYRP